MVSPPFGVSCYNKRPFQPRRTQTAPTTRRLLETNSRRTPRATATSASKTSNRPTLDAGKSRSRSKVKAEAPGCRKMIE